MRPLLALDAAASLLSATLHERGDREPASRTLHTRTPWILVLGDSRARLAYAALLSMLEFPIPGDWPHHNLSGECLPHGINASTGREYWGYYNPSCQTRWKGGCWDDVRGRNVVNVCTLDARVSSGVRVTYVWNSFNRQSYLQATFRRLSTLIDAGAPPDFMFVSAGLWDMNFDVNPCSGIRLLTSRLVQVVPPNRIRMMGFEACPRCPRRAARTCLHWRSIGGIAKYAQQADACLSDLCDRLGLVYVNVTTVTREMNSSSGEICGGMHLFGRGSERIVRPLYRDALHAAQPTVSVDFEAVRRQFREQALGNYRSFSDGNSTADLVMQQA